MSTIGALREKVLGAAKRTATKTPLPKLTIKKVKSKPSLLWSADKYEKGQEKN